MTGYVASVATFSSHIEAVVQVRTTLCLLQSWVETLASSDPVSTVQRLVFAVLFIEHLQIQKLHLGLKHSVTVFTYNMQISVFHSKDHVTFWNHYTLKPVQFGVCRSHLCFTPALFPVFSSHFFLFISGLSQHYVY